MGEQFKDVLEREIDLLERNKVLLDQLHKTTVQLEEYSNINEGLVKINNEKEESILTLLGAMVFYADKDNYHDYDEWNKPSTITEDEGERARKAIQISKYNA